MGAAFWIPDLDVSRGYKLNRISSSFSAEGMAIMKALDYMSEQNWKSINICFDSESP